MQRDDQKIDVFKIAKRMVKINHDIVGEQCIRNDDGVLAVSVENTKTVWKSYHEKPIRDNTVIKHNVIKDNKCETS